MTLHESNLRGCFHLQETGQGGEQALEETVFESGGFDPRRNPPACNTLCFSVHGLLSFVQSWFDEVENFSRPSLRATLQNSSCQEDSRHLPDQDGNDEKRDGTTPFHIARDRECIPHQRNHPDNASQYNKAPNDNFHSRES